MAELTVWLVEDEICDYWECSACGGIFYIYAEGSDSDDLCDTCWVEKEAAQ